MIHSEVRLTRHARERYAERFGEGFGDDFRLRYEAQHSRPVTSEKTRQLDAICGSPYGDSCYTEYADRIFVGKQERSCYVIVTVFVDPFSDRAERDALQMLEEMDV